MIDRITAKIIEEITAYLRPTLDILEKQYGMKIKIPRSNHSDVSCDLVIQCVLVNPEVNKRIAEENKEQFIKVAREDGFPEEWFGKVLKIAYGRSPELREFTVDSINPSRRYLGNPYYILLKDYNTNDIYHTDVNFIKNYFEKVDKQ